MAVASLFEDLLDQYKIEQHVADRQFTTVYQAYDVDEDRLVRLEVLGLTYARDTAFAGRFVARARALAQVRHPNIAPIYHVGRTPEDLPYIAQAFVDGYPLSERLAQLSQARTPVNSIYALKLVRELAEALLLGERLDLLHHDLQPDNVLLKHAAVSPDTTLVLLDLFVPPTQLPDHEPPQAAFLSPEQAAGKPVTRRSQVYSLGVLLYTLLAGHAPAGPVARKDVAVRRLFNRPSPLERERAGLAAATYALVDCALRRDPNQRHEGMEAFLAGLDGALAAEEIQIRTPVAAARRARRGWVVLLPLLVAVLFVTAGFVATQGLRDRASDSAAATDAGAQVAAAGDRVAEPPTEPTATAAEATPEGGVPAVVVAEPATATATEPAPSATATATPSPEPTATATATPSPTLTPTATAEPPPVVQVALNAVNLRRGPGVAYGSLGVLQAGRPLQVLARTTDEADLWLLVATDDERIGWIAATVVEPMDGMDLLDVAVAATVPPPPVPTSTPSPTPSPTTAVVLMTPTAETPSGGGSDGGGSPPPTAQPTEPAVEPTRTPPPLP